MKKGQVVARKDDPNKFYKIRKVWGKKPYAATCLDEFGPIRIPLYELRHLTAKERGK